MVHSQSIVQELLSLRRGGGLSLLCTALIGSMKLVSIHLFSKNMTFCTFFCCPPMRRDSVTRRSVLTALISTNLFGSDPQSLTG
uniref:Uncharacterized protein n=1 Tax=Amphimedon queenslandica TaxID=400682 RepID=A0A1X7TIP7_AMPQE